MLLCECREVGLGKWLGVEIALDAFNAQAAYIGCLLCGLNALGYNGEPDGVQ